MKLHRALAVCIGLWACAPGLHAQASPQVDATAFINGGGLEMPKLSPDGARLAGIVRTNTLRAVVTQKVDGSDRRVFYTEEKPGAVLDLMRWVSNERVLLRMSRSDGVRMDRGTLPVSRLVSIGVDNPNPKVMAPRNDDRRYITLGSFEGFPACSNSPFVTVGIGSRGRGESDLGRFDARSGELTDEITIRGRLLIWWVDSLGQARLFKSRNEDTDQWQWLPAGVSKPVAVDWAALKSYTAWQLLGFDAQPHQVLVLAERDGGWYVLRIDVNSPDQAEVLAHIGKMSNPERFTLLRNELNCQAVGLRNGDQTVLWGDDLAAFWAGLSQALPERQLVLAQWQGDRVLVQMSQANLPTRHLVGLRSARKLDVVTSSYSRLPGNLGLKEQVFAVGEAQGRWLQREDSKGTLPTVVCVSCELDRGDGGRYNPLSAYLAYRGFGVLHLSLNEPPKPLLDAQAYQVRLHDAALRMAAERGWSDPERVAIVGGHGNASWMAMAIGSAQRPAVRAVAVSGLVSDMGRYVYWDMQGDPASASYREMIGEATEAELSAASPMARLAQWQAPLLLVHAEQDTMVRVQQSRVLADALKAAGKPVTFLRLPSATQSLAHPPDRTQVVQAIDELLAPLLVKTP